jgi:hypothetical protein
MVCKCLPFELDHEPDSPPPFSGMSMAPQLGCSIAFGEYCTPLIVIRRRRGAPRVGELPSPSSISSAARLPPSILDYIIISRSRDVISRSLGHMRGRRLIVL